MRILVVSQYFWPETFRVNDLVAELVARGHEVTVLTGVPNYPDGKVFPEYVADPKQYSSYAGAKVHRVPMRPRGKGSRQLLLNYLSFALSGLLFGPWQLRGQAFDAIIVFQGSPVTSALPALLLRSLKQAPVLMWVLDLWPESLAAVGAVRSPRVLGWVGKLVSFIYRRCDLILAQSRAFFSSIEHLSGDASRIRYLPGWAEATFQAAEMPYEDPPSELAPYLAQFTVMFAGNVGDAQDFPAILEAAHLLRNRRDIRWLIVGDGRAADRVRQDIDRLGLHDQVVMLGRHPIDAMPRFFRAASALLVPLKADPVFASTIPGKVQSYLAAGKPIIGMLDGEGARVIEESGAGLTCGAGQAAMLAKCVERLAALPPGQRVMMGEQGRHYCKLEFDRAELITRLEGWLMQAVESRAATGLRKP